MSGTWYAPDGTPRAPDTPTDGADSWVGTDDTDFEFNEFGEAVSRLLRSPELCGRIGAAGRALYEREFTWEAGWRKLAALGL